MIFPIAALQSGCYVCPRNQKPHGRCWLRAVLLLGLAHDAAGMSAKPPARLAKQVALMPPPPAFSKDFTRPMSVPEEGIEAAVEVMRSGRLFRYSAKPEESQVSLAEREFAAMVDAKHALAVNSCSSAILLALMVAGVRAGDEVLTNGFTFTAVPSTIMRLGAAPVLVEAAEGWTMDLRDLEAKAEAHPSAKVLLLSHMRGKICDMDAVAALCAARGLTLVEDCAHACGVLWRGKQLGHHGAVSAYSTQSDKVINSGEGGFLTTDDDERIATAIYLSGAYEKRYAWHLSAPAEQCEAAMLTTPNLSCRMSEVTAAMARPLIKNLPERVAEYNRRYALVLSTLAAHAAGLISVPSQLPAVRGVGDHLNFMLSGLSAEANAAFEATCRSLGVPVANFASAINARYHVNWREYGAPPYELPQTDALLGRSYDLKLPPHFEDADCVHLAEVIAFAARSAALGDSIDADAHAPFRP